PTSPEGSTIIAGSATAGSTTSGPTLKGLNVPANLPVKKTRKITPNPPPARKQIYIMCSQLFMTLQKTHYHKNPILPHQLFCTICKHMVSDMLLQKDVASPNAIL
ncbi:MAG: hypothetical protein V4649_09550, partial [Bacteroidota bacterium]